MWEMKAVKTKTTTGEIQVVSIDLVAESIGHNSLTAQRLHHSQEEADIRKAEREGIAEKPGGPLFSAEQPSHARAKIKSDLQKPRRHEASFKGKPSVAQENEDQEKRGQPAQQLV